MPNNILVLAIVGIAAAALIIFLVWKNQKDKKALNPDAQDSVENLHSDQQRNADKL